MRKLLCLAIAVLLAMSIAAPALAETPEATITVLALTGDEERWDNVVAAFNRHYPNIHVQFEMYPYTQMIEVLEVKLGSGDTSLDLIYTNCPEIDGYVDRGYLLALDEYFSEEDLSLWVDKSRNWGTVGEHFYSPPLNSSSQLLYYNKDLLDAAGIAYPSDSVDERLTWEQVAPMARAVMEKLNADGTTGVWGLAYQQVDVPYQILALPNSLGGVGVEGDDGLTVTGVVNNEAWLRAMTYYYDLANTWSVLPKGTSDPNELFSAGKLAFLAGGPWVLNQFNEIEELHWGYAPHPYFEGGQVAIPTDSWHLAVSAFSQNPAATAALVHWMTCDEEGIRVSFENFGNLPCAKFLLQEIVDDADGRYSAFPMSAYKVCCYDELNHSFSRPKTVGFREWDYAMSEAFQDIRNGADPQETLDMAAENIDAAFAKYR